MARTLQGNQNHCSYFKRTTLNKKGKKEEANFIENTFVLNALHMFPHLTFITNMRRIKLPHNFLI